jgi:plasmid stabilization system protein ParE
MSFEIKWSEKAENQLYDIFNYLEKEWSLKVALNFTEEVDFILDLLKESPFIGQEYETENSNVRFLLISKHNTLFYLIENNSINLLNIFDNRQDPIKPKF